MPKINGNEIFIRNQVTEKGKKLVSSCNTPNEGRIILQNLMGNVIKIEDVDPSYDAVLTATREIMDRVTIDKAVIDDFVSFFVPAILILGTGEVRQILLEEETN